MALFRCGARPRVGRRIAVWALAGVLAGIAASAAERTALAADPIPGAGHTITVILDQAKILKLPDRTSTLVIGNPLIADFTVQAGGLLVLTGKSYGVTNLVALDRGGSVLMEHPVEVQGPREQVVQVYRGVERESYSCTPMCERRITLGDSQTYFAGTLGQSGTLSTQATQGTQK